MKFVIDFYSYDMDDNRTDHDTVVVEASCEKVAEEIAEAMHEEVAFEAGEDYAADNIGHRITELNEWIREAEKAASKYLDDLTDFQEQSQDIQGE